MFYIYALLFESGRIYVGMTSDLETRIKDHKRGKTKSTKNRGNFQVAILGEAENRTNARQKEKYWKSGCGKEKIKTTWSGSSVGYLPAGRQGALPCYVLYLCSVI
ncbi:MAG: GIY-YIG nuclease family protein [Patescibacteria group bacterium]